MTATKILLENGANPNTYNDDHTSTMLQQALGNSTFQFIEFSYKQKWINKMIGLGVDVGEEIIDLLIEHGANVCVQIYYRYLLILTPNPFHR